MITFEFTDDTVDGRVIWFLGTTQVVGVDKQHQSEIYEQLDAQTVGWA